MNENQHSGRVVFRYLQVAPFGQAQVAVLDRANVGLLNDSNCKVMIAPVVFLSELSVA